MKKVQIPFRTTEEIKRKAEELARVDYDRSRTQIIEMLIVKEYERVFGKGHL